jgi:hypothetical protein
MLPHGAQHPGGMAVPAIRVGAGGHRPRRTSQLAPIRLRQHARGTTLRSRVVEGAQDSTRRGNFGDLRTCSLARFFLRREFSAPLTKLRVRRPLHHGSLAARAPVVPLPRFAGADGASARILAARLGARVFSARDSERSARQQRTVTSIAKPVRSKEGQGWGLPFGLPFLVS